MPYRRKPAGNKDELFIGATDRNTILTDMINDLIEVEPLMLYAEESDRGVEAASREFCQALIARIALQRGGWASGRIMIILLLWVRWSGATIGKNIIK